MAFHCCGIDGGHKRDCVEGIRERDESMQRAISRATSGHDRRLVSVRDVEAKERLADAMQRIAGALERLADKERAL